MIEEKNYNALFSELKRELAAGNKALSKLDRNILQAMTTTGNSNTNLLNTVVGTKGVVDVRNEATAIFNRYSNLVGTYGDAKSEIKYLIADFVKLREQVCQTYWKYAIVLTDVFGNSIKAIAPELFDFDTIEWLDIQKMLQSIKLDYDKITGKCTTLMSEISDSFTNAIKSASTSYRIAGSKQAGLIMAALNMASHYLDASQKTTELKQDLLMLKNSVKHDVTLIKGDLGRLTVIYKNLNDLFIPQCEAFCRYSSQVLTREWTEIEESLYSDKAISDMKTQRDELLAKYKELDDDIADSEMNISYYTTHLDECKQLLESIEPQYKEAKYRKPSKPSVLANLFTLGSAGKRYNRDIYEWMEECKPVVSRYETLHMDVKLDSDELKQHRERLAKNQRERNELKHKLGQQNKLIMSKIQANPSVRRKLIPHLEAMVRLLRMAREIANSRLDFKLTKVVNIIRQDTELPEEIRENIRSFAQTMRDVTYKKHRQEQKALTEAINARNANEANNQDLTPEQQQRQKVERGQLEQAEKDLSQLMASGSDAIVRTINVLEAWGTLTAMKQKSAIAHKAYDIELAKLQAEFRKNLEDIDNKSAIVRESLRRMNTAQTPQELKEGLLSLSGKDSSMFTEKDWNDFLTGQKTIEL